MPEVNAIIFSTKVMKNCLVTGTRAFDIPSRCMIGGHAGCLCNAFDLDFVVQSSGGLATSWHGVNGLSGSSSQCAAMTDFALPLASDAFLPLIHVDMVPRNDSGTSGTSGTAGGIV